MKQLIEALQIFLKYDNPNHPTACEHDVMYVFISPSVVSKEDIEALDGLGFSPSEDLDNFYSYKYGSA